MSEIAIKLDNVSKFYKFYDSPGDRLKEALHPLGKSYHKDFYALKNINLEIKKGEILGIVGKNGCGKSTLLKIISGVLTPNDGTVAVNGKISALLELGSGFNPEFTGIQNIFFYGSILGFSRTEMVAKLDDIIAFADIGDFVYRQLKTYSSGMQARLGFAVAVHIDPEILILDEVLSVGDSLFQRKCYAKMEEFFNGGKTILYVSHDANSINELCSRAVLIADGEVLLESDPKTVITYYQKYLFSKNKDESIIKNEIKKLQIRNNRDKNISDLQEKEKEKEKELRAFFVKNYKPVSTVENANYDVKIYDVRISEVGGSSLVNHLIKNEKYELAFSVKFNESAKFVKFGCQIKNKKGFIICGYTLPGREKPVGFVKAEEAFEVKFGFSCNLSIGEYFIDVGLTSDINDEKIYLNMIHDVLCFKVLSCGDDSWGQTNLWSENNCSAKLIV